MRCKDAERMIVESDGRAAIGGREALDEHLAGCRRCGRFRDEVERIQGQRGKIPRPVPSATLLEETRRRCLAAIAAGPESDGAPAKRTSGPAVPAPIWAALAALIVLTGLIMIPGLRDLLTRTRSFLSATVLALILQNAMTLILAPILLRARRNRHVNMGSLPLNGSAS